MEKLIFAYFNICCLFPFPVCPDFATVANVSFDFFRVVVRIEFERLEKEAGRERAPRREGCQYRWRKWKEEEGRIRFDVFVAVD